MGAEAAVCPGEAVCTGYHGRNGESSLTFQGDACLAAYPYIHILDNPHPEEGLSRAATTVPCFLRSALFPLPSPLLQCAGMGAGCRVEAATMPIAGRGVVTKVGLKAGTIFGPYEGTEEEDEETAMAGGFAWSVLDDAAEADDAVLHFIDAVDPANSNWLRFVNAARCLHLYLLPLFFLQHQPSIMSSSRGAERLRVLLPGQNMVPPLQGCPQELRATQFHILHSNRLKCRTGNKMNCSVVRPYLQCEPRLRIVS